MAKIIDGDMIALYECLRMANKGFTPRLEQADFDTTAKKLYDGDYIIMITDGVMDALPVGEQEVLLKMMIEGNTKTNPKEMAEHLLGQVLECSGEIPMDDMTRVAYAALYPQIDADKLKYKEKCEKSVDCKERICYSLQAR